MTVPGSALTLSNRLGSYELIRPIAQGGMADIYLARRVGPGRFERHVAVKVLNPRRAAEPEACAMFLDEARLVALLNHHNIASVLEVDVVDGKHYLAMEYVHGADLREVLSAAQRAGKLLPFETSLSIVSAAAAGLDHAHRRCGLDGKPLKLVHRDVSLSNIMVGHDGSVKVVDFGIATTTIASVHTSPGVVRGKASYMSPEQCLGDRVDHRSDVFALGVVLYELTTGARCFHGKSDFDRMLAVVRGDGRGARARRPCPQLGRRPRCDPARDARAVRRRARTLDVVCRRRSRHRAAIDRLAAADRRADPAGAPARPRHAVRLLRRSGRADAGSRTAAPGQPAVARRLTVARSPQQRLERR
jgi:serine/threonine protein kinase